MVTLQAVPMDEQFKERRLAYFDSLSQPQEMFVEMKVNPGAAFSIVSAGKPVGYVILSVDRIILEFYLTDYMVHKSEAVFGELLKALGCTRAYCKTFDSILLKCGLAYAKQTKVIGTLFRDRVAYPGSASEPELLTRLANQQDIPEIQAVGEGLFESNEEVVWFVQQEKLLVFSDQTRDLGWGVFQPVMEGRTVVDIGMLVHPDHRCQGIGTAILRYLKDYCLQNHWQPICGCAKENIGSRRAIEKAGFVSKYDLLEFEF